MMTEEKALALAILALDEVAKRHGNESVVNEWYVARRTIKAMLSRCETGIGVPSANADGTNSPQR